MALVKTGQNKSKKREVPTADAKLIEQNEALTSKIDYNESVIEGLNGDNAELTKAGENLAAELKEVEEVNDSLVESEAKLKAEVVKLKSEITKLKKA